MLSIGLLMYLIYGGFIAICLFGLYLVLSSLLGKYLIAKRDHTAALREQNEILKDIAKAVKPGNNDSTPPHIS
mgnify:CR=1 FL=1